MCGLRDDTRQGISSGFGLFSAVLGGKLYSQNRFNYLEKNGLCLSTGGPPEPVHVEDVRVNSRFPSPLSRDAIPLPRDPAPPTPHPPHRPRHRPLRRLSLTDGRYTAAPVSLLILLTAGSPPTRDARVDPPSLAAMPALAPLVGRATAS
jgi:hypothetical protein